MAEFLDSKRFRKTVLVVDKKFRLFFGGATVSFSFKPT